MVALKDLFRNPTAFELDLAERYSRLPRSPQRDRNFEAFAGTGLPHGRVEAWKYSDLRNALNEAPKLEERVPTTPFSAIEDAVVFTFGAKGFKAPKVLPKGLRIIEQDNAQALGGAEDTPVAALGAALSAKPGAVLIEVTDSIETPLHLVFETTADLDFSRVSFVVRDGAELTVLESHLASGGFSSRVIEYGLQDKARVNRSIYQAASKSAVQVFTCLAHLNAGASFNQMALGFGAKLCRNETRIYHHGEGANADLNAAYLVGDGYHYDQTSLVRHSHADCETHQLCKGAVLDGGQAVFQGKFFVARKAQRTDAEMAHHALILENGGEINAKPELEIYADDVQCAHGNTVGALDETALFYMRQRGIPEKAARALLTEAFINETFENAPETVKDSLTASAQAWLEAQA